jgi:thioredoxin-related protein
MWMKFLALIWFTVLSIPLSMMMGSHQLSLKSSKNPALTNLSATQSKAWTIMHFVNPECGCSEKVVTSLKNRKAKDIKTSEQVFILGKNAQWEQNLKAAGYKVMTGKMDDFAEKYSISAVPQLVIINAQKEILYTGGYSSKRGPASIVEDEQIFQEVTAKKNSTERPIYGCVNGRKNQSDTDYVGSKYKREL